MRRTSSAIVLVALACTIILSSCERAKPPAALPPAASAKEKSSEEDVLDFLASLFANADFVREMEPIYGRLVTQRVADMTWEGEQKIDQEIATLWNEKAGPIFWGSVAASGVDIEAVESFLKPFAEHSLDRQKAIARQKLIAGRMPQEKRRGACNILVLGFLYQQIIRNRAFQIHLQAGFDGTLVTVTVDGMLGYIGRPETGEVVNIAELIEAKASTPTPTIGLNAPDMGIRWGMEVNLYKGHAIGLSVYNGKVIMKQANGFGYD